MEVSNIKIPYEILDYNKYKKRINDLIEQNGLKNKFPLKKHEPFTYTDCGFPVDHYSIGEGRKHILVMAGTHGCEIISVDFVTQLMKQIAEGNISGFSPDEFTIDFIPLHNPEGFIVSSSAAYYKIGNMNDEEIEKFCHDYWFYYRQDDINSKNNPDDHKLNLHHQLFSGITLDCIPNLDDRYLKLKEKMNIIFNGKMGNYTIPIEAMIDFRANGNGVELNGNTPNSYRNKLNELKEKNGIIFGSRRFSDIPNAINGPLGLPSRDMNNFCYEKENTCLFEYLSKLNKKGDYYLTATYHGTGGLIYHRPYNLKDDETEQARIWKDQHNIPEIFNYNNIINEIIANSYHEKTGYTFMNNPKRISGIGDVLRSVYPGFLLIELSKMGGNPIAPYGDRIGNYEPTIRSNLEAFNSTLKNIKKVEELYGKTFMISREEFNYGRKRK